MARRRPRRSAAQRSEGQRPAPRPSGGVNWLIVLGLGLLVLVLIVTMVPLA